ncbi:hypothetical protein [Emticicia fontis]
METFASYLVLNGDEWKHKGDNWQVISTSGRKRRLIGEYFRPMAENPG